MKRRTTIYATAQLRYRTTHCTTPIWTVVRRTDVLRKYVKVQKQTSRLLGFVSRRQTSKPNYIMYNATQNRTKSIISALLVQQLYTNNYTGCG